MLDKLNNSHSLAKVSEKLLPRDILNYGDGPRPYSSSSHRDIPPKY